MVVIVGGGGLCTTTLKVLVVVVVAAPPAQSCTVVVVVIVGGGFCTILKVAAAPADPPAVFLSTSVLTLAKLPIRPPTRPLVMIARSAERAGVMTGERKSYRRGAWSVNELRLAGGGGRGAAGILFANELTYAW